MSVYSKQINYRWAPRGLRGALFHDWQYLSMRVAAKTAYTSLRIILVYECNANVVYFDGVQLFNTYGPWGEAWGVSGTLASTLGAMNPLRYRGYVYDTETGLYYLNSRYYNPTWGRFINTDSEMAGIGGDTQGYNLFAYCQNNPVNMSDHDGNWPKWATKLVAAAAIVAVVTVVAAVTVATAGAGTVAAVVAVGAAKGAVVGMLSGAVLGAVTEAVSHRVSSGSWRGAGTAALDGMSDGALSGATSGMVAGMASSAAKASHAARKVIGTIKNDVLGLPRVGSALKPDPYHAFSDIIDNYAGYAAKKSLGNATLYQLKGSLNGTAGRFEWIIQNNKVTHRFFVAGGVINGLPNKPN